MGAWWGAGARGRGVRGLCASRQTWQEAVQGSTAASTPLLGSFVRAGPTAAHLWVDVPEGQCLVILINNGGRDLLGHNPVEQGGTVTVCLPAGMERARKQFS